MITPGVLYFQALMYCVKCGSSNKGDARFCVNCGERLHASPQPAPAAQTAPTGVGGWLLVFCVYVTLLFPLFTIIGLINNYKDARLVSGSTQKPWPS